MKGHQYLWLASGYNLETGHFLQVASMVTTWWIEAFLRSVVVRQRFEHYMDTSDDKVNLELSTT